MNLQETAALRKRVLANGYRPLASLDKRCVLPDWPRVVVNEAMIDRWTRMKRYAATGIRVEGGLAVIDIDVNDAVLTAKISDWIIANVPELGNPGAPLLVRVGKGHKEAWFVRTAEAFSRLHTHRFVRPGETADDGTHSVEIFGGGSPRQFGAFGPHTREDDGTVTVEYQWVEGASPLNTRLDQLPVLTKSQFAAIADAAGRFMKEAGWEQVLRSTAGESERYRVYDLTDDMIFEMDKMRGSLSLQQLREALKGEPGGMRCSASWLEGASAKNTSRCLVSLTRAGAVAIWESAAGVTHVEADAAPRDFSAEINRVAEKLKELDLKERTMIKPSDDCATVATKLIESHAYVPTARFPVVDILNGGEEGGVTVTNFRLAMLPHAMEEVGPRGGVRKINPVDIWMSDSRRIKAAGMQMRPDMPRPLFQEDGKTWVNTYRPALPEGEGGSAEGGLEFLAQMLPDDRERAWFVRWLAFKYRHPWIPGPAVLMVARSFGTGRGTLARFIERLFGSRYVKRLPFHIFSGKSYQSQYNDWETDALVAVISESSDAGNGTKWEAKSSTYERLKDLVEPAPTRKLIVRKGERNNVALSFTSYIIATNHVDALPIPEGDRRFAVLSNGEPGSETFWKNVNAWLDNEANIAAFAAWLGEVDLSDYSPFVAPPMTRAKEAMVDANTSDLERGMDTAFENLPGEVFAIPQIVSLMRQAMKVDGLDYPDKWPAIAKRLARQRGQRIGVRHGNNWFVSVNGQRHPTYAKTAAAALYWTSAPYEDLKAELAKSGAVGDDDASSIVAGMFRG